MGGKSEVLPASSDRFLSLSQAVVHLDRFFQMRRLGRTSYTGHMLSIECFAKWLLPLSVKVASLRDHGFGLGLRVSDLCHPVLELSVRLFVRLTSSIVSRVTHVEWPKLRFVPISPSVRGKGSG